MSEGKRVVATIEARMGSSRLPGKVLKEILGKPMLQLMCSRLGFSREIDEVVVATTVNRKDDAIEELCGRMGVKVFRGSEEDVLGRVVGAVESVKGDVIVELTGDCPLMDPHLIDSMARSYLGKDCDVLSNTRPYTLPEGFDIQIFPHEKLRWVSENITDPAVREHVSLYFYENPGKYNLMNYEGEKWAWRPDWHLSVDEAGDFEVVKAVFEELYPKKPDFSVYDVVRFLDGHPEVKKMNEGVRIKKAR